MKASQKVSLNLRDDLEIRPLAGTRRAVVGAPRSQGGCVSRSLLRLVSPNFVQDDDVDMTSAAQGRLMLHGD